MDYYTGERTDYGLALVAPVIDSVRGANPPGTTYLFDSGDLLQGTPIAYLSARLQSDSASPIIGAMNRMRYDAAAVGNHEYNYGIEHLERAVRQAAFPFVSANTFVHGSDRHAFRPYVLLPHVVAEGDTILVGVTGNTPPGVAIWDRANIEGRLDFRDVVGSLRPVVREMRERGADLVIVLSHGGLEGSSYDTLSSAVPPENAAARLAREVPGIDLIFLGHTHRELADTLIAGVLLTQAKNWARSVAAVEVRMRRRAPSRWRVASKSARLLRPRAGVVDTALVDALQSVHRRTLAWVGSELGRSTQAMNAWRSRVEDTPIVDFINEVQRRAAGTQLAAASAFDIRSRIPEGAVTIADIAGLYIYDNTLKAVRITGTQLRAYLEKSAEYYEGWPPPAGGTVTDPDVPGYNFDAISGVDYTIDLSRPRGERIMDLTYRGRPVRPEQSFTLALNSYRQGGGGGYAMLADAPVIYDRQQDIRDLLIEEVRRLGTVGPARYFHRNWRITPPAAVDSALQEQLAEAAERAGAAARAKSHTAPSAEGAPRLRVIATSDFHGHLTPEAYSWSHGREVGGAAALAAYFRRERKEASKRGVPTVLLDAGDVMQGTPVSNLTGGRASVAFFDSAGYAAAAIGNHEFDWSADSLRARMADAKFHWLAANVVVAGSDTAPDWIRPTAMLRAGSVRVGVIGLAAEETPTTTKPSNVTGLRFRDGAAAIDEWVPRLRAAGADFVVVVAHAGAACPVYRDAAADGEATYGSAAVLERSCEGEVVDWAGRVTHRPDLIVAGHTHRPVETRVNGIPIVEPASYGSRYDVVDLTRVSTDSVGAAIRSVTPWTEAVRPDSAIATLVEEYRSGIGSRIERVIATIAAPLERAGPQYALGNLIADAQRAAGHAQVAIMNNGGIRASLPAGAVTWRELYELQPFGNSIVVLRLEGRRLRQALEHAVSGRGPSVHVSGLSVSYDPTLPPGHRILSLRLYGGRDVQDDQVYSVAVNDFMADGGSGFSMLKRAPGREETGITDLDALIEYLQTRRQPIRAPAGDRIRSAGPERHSQSPDAHP